MDKVVVTVVGKDRLGILAKTCTYLADSGINILDISQTIVRDYFNMMMIVDVSGSNKGFDEIGADLARIGVEMGLRIRCQREEIFEKMHRV